MNDGSDSGRIKICVCSFHEWAVTLRDDCVQIW